MATYAYKVRDKQGQLVEGTIEADTPVASESGKLFLSRNVFFDRRVFDPDAPPG